MNQDRFVVVGMLHLPALPGSPGSSLSLPEIETRTLQEAEIYERAGIDTCILENFGDVPFWGAEVPPITVAAMSRCVLAVRNAFPNLQIGVNVLRNDAQAALSVACATSAHFVRVNVHVGVTATDQGLLEGQAAATMRLRKHLNAKVAIWADVFVKHGRNLSHVSIGAEAEDAVRRGLAQALIISGAGTGRATDAADVVSVRQLELGVPLFVGSGVSADNVSEYLAVADGVIVGTAFKSGSDARGPVDESRVRTFLQATKAKLG